MIRAAGALAVAILWAVVAADAVAQGDAASDRAALEAIYRATGGDNWTDNTNWLSNAPVEDWYGVEVTDGRVTRLRLGGWDETARDVVGNGLTGSLPPELGTLSHLQWLEIGGNRALTGPIPAELGNLAAIKGLSLARNWLTGPIPAALGRLGNLEELWLDSNALSGAIPTELGNLTSLRQLSLDVNVLSGPIPPTLGNLTSLTGLGFGYTMLSGPLPDSLTSLSALQWLNIDGSGLCAPDSPAMRAWVATIPDFSGASCEGSVSFLRVLTQPGLGRLDNVLAVADFDGDGRDDILAGGLNEYDAYASSMTAKPEDRLGPKATLHMFVAVGDGSFRHAPELIEGTIAVRSPIVVADDFNGDGRADLAVFDEGVYVFAVRKGYGNPPQLFLSSPGGRLRPSDALADAVIREHEREDPPSGISSPADLHLKSATSGDIDLDGDTDIWVTSSGGLNVFDHFMVNNGDGTFTIERERASDMVLFNVPVDWWNFIGNHLVDLNNDGAPELVLGPLGPGRLGLGSPSLVLANDGTGHYPTRTVLPRPADFNGGYTRVNWLTHFDVNNDGFQDLLLAHRRLYEGPTAEIPNTGRYIQVLINRGGSSFGDETPTWMGDQSATTPERDAEGIELINDAAPRMHDIDHDGCADLVMSRNLNPVRIESPLVYRNDGSGRFQAMSPVPFGGSDRHFGQFAVPIDVNGDRAIDFVIAQRDRGPDRQYDTPDDSTILVTLLNTTPPGPIRCADPANRPPAPAGTLPDRSLALDDTLNVDVSRAFADPDGDALTYTVSSSAAQVVTASAAGAVVTLTALGEGTATIRVTATDPGGLNATQSFTVTVVDDDGIGVPFTDDPIQPGVTPVRAVHFTELRSRIDALRVGTDLGRFAWTDPVLRAGVTPVRRVHLLELRAALSAAYAAAGRAAPRWTDAAPTAGSTPIRAAHVTELRAAVLALE